jgi:hypothetical protein
MAIQAGNHAQVSMMTGVFVRKHSFENKMSGLAPMLDIAGGKDTVNERVAAWTR